MFSDWTRSDVLTAVGIVVAVLVGIACVWAALFSPQFQEWWKRRAEGARPITLGSLSEAAPYHVPLAPGVVNADSQTLAVLLKAFEEVDIEWLRTFDFGGAFRWSEVAKIREYAWHNARPEHGFIDTELERLRKQLTSAILEFSRVAGFLTKAISRHDDDEVRRIPGIYEDSQYSDRKFFEKSEQINAAAGEVHEAYTALVNRARLKLALYATTEGES